MEKYSDFRDNFTGINPFLNPRRKKLTFKGILKAILKLPLLLLLYCNINTIDWLIRINKKDVKSIENHATIACNSVSVFDKYVIKKIFRADIIRYNIKFVFPEGCSSNGMAILKFNNNIECDYVCGLRYSEGCILSYGNYYKFLFYFLATENIVDICMMKSKNPKDLCKVTGLLQIDLGKEDKKRFMAILNKTK
ncbi:hypothetical protein TCON_1116 [Astathelohania contejeani]|uniref:Uncharacterized protein n=1 Tax=Astathelohania contejeani TaxID=164912 RepID=A0ABQ7HZW6_9MICR|nr:hypothetical protein TCON_1116 [Thelohania contejeani]